MMGEISVDDLYERYAIISDSTKSQEEKTSAYRDIIDGFESGGENERKLSSQLMCRCFNQFPDLRDTALSSIQKLLVDKSVSIRKQATHDIPSLVKQYPECMKQLSQSLLKVLTTDDQTELILIHKTLLILIDQDPFECLNTILDELDESYEVDPLIPNRIIQFMLSKHQQIINGGNVSKSSTRDLNQSAAASVASTESLTLEQQTKIVKRLKQSMERANPGELFIGLLQFVQKFHVCQSLLARQELVNIILEKAKINEASSHLHETSKLVVLLSCIQQCLTLFSRNAPSTEFSCFALDTLMPQLQNDKWSTEERLQILRLLAELMDFCGEMDAELFEKHYNAVFHFLKGFLIEPPEDPSDSVDPNFELSSIECVLFIHHCLCRTNPNFLQRNEIAMNELKSIKIRLQYLGQAVQHYLRQLKIQKRPQDLRVQKSEDQIKLVDNDEKIRLASTTVCTNIHQLIRSLFHNPPSFKSKIDLSWKQPFRKMQEHLVSPSSSDLRRRPIKDDSPSSLSDGKRSRLDTSEAMRHENKSPRARDYRRPDLEEADDVFEKRRQRFK